MVDVLAICSHPDDAELCCGGYLLKASAAGMSTGVIDLSSGDMGTRGTPETRSLEAVEGARLLGLSTRECLNIPDGHIMYSQENIALVAAAIRRLRPQIILTPYWEDHHPDHANTSRIVKDAWWFAGVAFLLLFIWAAPKLTTQKIESARSEGVVSKAASESDATVNTPVDEGGQGASE